MAKRLSATMEFTVREVGEEQILGRALYQGDIDLADQVLEDDQARDAAVTAALERMAEDLKAQAQDLTDKLDEAGAL